MLTIMLPQLHYAQIVLTTYSTKGAEYLLMIQTLLIFSHWQMLLKIGEVYFSQFSSSDF